MSTTDKNPVSERLALIAGLSAFTAFLAIVVALFSYSESSSVAATPAGNQVAAATSGAPGPPLSAAEGVKFEPYKFVDPTLPAVPAGAVKRFTVDVEQHVTQVSPDLAPTEAWTYRINGQATPGTATSLPIVVNEGDSVSIKFVNGSTKSLGVNMPHSIDFHSAEVAPNKNYVDVMPGKSIDINFDAKHPGVFMYHCATQPVLMHTSAGMMGMMVVKPKNLAPVDRELWMTQEEYYLGEPGKAADMEKMAAETPDVIAFNGYANQYKTHPITVKAGEKIRMYVLDAGPSKWSAFHVIGTVFDTTHFEGVVGHDSQTVSLAPSQGGWVEFTLDAEGNYPFVTHAFGDMVKGAAGILHTSGAPMPAGVTAPVASGAAAGAKKMPGMSGSMGAGNTVHANLGEMFIKLNTASMASGLITFDTHNIGAVGHELVILKTDKAAASLGSGATVPEAGRVGETGDIAAGKSKTIKVKLASGHYALICNIAGHYAGGMRTDFTVK
ncbi:MAG: multicopper oxidase domain-containing protein [Actinomycetes bacterium]